MESFDCLDKINIPMCVCDRDWMVVYRNAACKKYARSPRRNTNIKRRFIDRESIAFPDSGSDMFFVSCLVNDTYKTAVCFGYSGHAVLAFPAIMDYDILFADILKNKNAALAEQIRYLLDNVFCENTAHSDRVIGVIDKLRKSVYSAIENYVALSAFDAEKRIPASFSQIYKFMADSFVSVANKAGFKVTADLTRIAELGETVYTDTMYFAAALSSVMLFCLEISKDNRCLVIPEHLGDRMRNTVRFKCGPVTSDIGITGSLAELAREFPAEYLNLLPIDQLCSVLGWDLAFEMERGEELNCSVKMDIAIDNKFIFNSTGNAAACDPADIISQIISLVVFVK